MKGNKKLKIIGGKGIHIAFRNGLTISIQFGNMNYCQNSNDPIIDPKTTELIKQKGECDDCEVAVLDFEGNFVTGRVLEKFCEEITDKVIPNVTTEELAEMMMTTKNHRT